MSDAAPTTAETAATPAPAAPADAAESTVTPPPPSVRSLAIRKVLLVAMCAVFGAAVVVATIYAIAGFDGYGLFSVPVLIVVALNLLIWRWLTPKIDRAPAAGRKAAIVVTATIMIAALSVAAVFALVLLSWFVIAWTGQ